MEGHGVFRVSTISVLICSNDGVGVAYFLFHFQGGQAMGARPIFEDFSTQARKPSDYQQSTRYQHKISIFRPILIKLSSINFRLVLGTTIPFCSNLTRYYTVFRERRQRPF